MTINKAALHQAQAARKQYRTNTPLTLQSIEGEDAVFVAAYQEAVAGVAQQPDDSTGKTFLSAIAAADFLMRLAQILSPVERLKGMGELALDHAANLFALRNGALEREVQQPVECRQAFEKWHLNDCGWACDEYWDDDTYEHPDIQTKWGAWRAAWNHRKPERESKTLKDLAGYKFDSSEYIPIGVHPARVSGSEIHRLKTREHLLEVMMRQVAIYAGRVDGGLATLQSLMRKAETGETITCESCGVESAGIARHEADCAIVIKYEAIINSDIARRG